MRALADTSAMVAAERGDAQARARLEQITEDGQLWICDAVRLELLRGAPNARYMTALRADLDGLRSAPIDAQAWQRAEEVYEDLARLRGGHHRGVSATDLLVAAVAEARALPVVHKDDHFDLIAAVTGQPMIRLP